MQRPADERFQEIYARHSDAVSAYVRRRAPADVVEDVVAETFLICWRRFELVPQQPLPWLYAVARKTLANERRRRGRTVAVGYPPTFVEQPPVGDASLAGAFIALSERDREVLRLVAWEGLALREAAVVLGCSAVACRVRFHRAKRRLAERLAELEESPTARAQPCPEGATR